MIIMDDIKKDKNFLAQIPRWEGEYKTNKEKIIKFEKKDWKSASIDSTEHQLKIFGCEVMEDWETSY